MSFLGLSSEQGVAAVVIQEDLTTAETVAAATEIPPGVPRSERLAHFESTNGKRNCTFGLELHE